MQLAGVYTRNQQTDKALKLTMIFTKSMDMVRFSYLSQ